MFRGLPAATQEAAKEKAVDAAVHHLCSHHNIAINDHNYNALKTMYKSCSAAQEWSKTKEEELQLQTQQKIALQRDKARRTRILKKICLRFQDVLPFRREPGHASSNFNIIYTGNKPPTTRMEELASSLYQYITETNPTGESTSQV